MPKREILRRIRRTHNTYSHVCLTGRHISSSSHIRGRIVSGQNTTHQTNTFSYLQISTSVSRMNRTYIEEKARCVCAGEEGKMGELAGCRSLVVVYLSSTFGFYTCQSTAALFSPQQMSVLSGAKRLAGSVRMSDNTVSFISGISHTRLGGSATSFSSSTSAMVSRTMVRRLCSSRNGKATKNEHTGNAYFRSST